tara:strand:- start:7702 stop:10224 length:2523 start_codon:yes stop_codon:yes gene_type:complete
VSGFKTSLYVGGDATGAKKALAETTSALAGTKKATDSLSKSTAALDQSTRSAANENSNFATGEKAVQQAVTRSNTAVQQRIERLTGYGAATNSARQSAAAFGGTIDQNKASFDAMRMSIDPVYRASRQYEAVVDETRRSVAAGAATQAEANRVLALAEAQYLATGQSAQVMGRSNNAAAGQMGNLVAQFNDIGVMMAAGQNPLTLALQQGTQISQVIGPMGAAGAVKALGGAFLGMLNPVSLITIGSIAAGAALFKLGSSAFAAEEKTDDLGDAMSELAKETAAARAEVELFNRGLDTTAQLAVLNEIAKKEAEIVALRQYEKFGPRYFPGETDREVGLIEEEIALLERGLTARNSAVAAAERLQRIQEMANSAGQDYVQRLEAEAAAVSKGQELIAGLQAEAEIRRAITAHGESSRQVAELRLAEERRVYEASLDTLNVTGEMKDEIMAAWDAANALSSVDIAAGISPAVAQAAALAQNLGIALNEALSLQNMQAGAVYSGRGDGMAEVRARRGETNKTDGRFIYTGPRLDADNNPIVNKTRTGGGGGSSAANALKKEREAVTDLISGLEDELALLRETDPVQQEMLRHRENLAGATEAERAKISELIATRNREKTAVDEQKAAWDSYRDVAYGTFEDLRRSGGDLGGVLDTLSGKIQDMAFQALLLGEGPLAQLFGTSGGGGLIDLALGAIFPGIKPAGQKLAVGGMVYGRGGGKSDQVPLWGSPGEYMVNAKATAKNRTLLEMINAGADIPGFANGGQIGGASGGFGGIDMRPQITIENHSSASITQTRQESVDSQGRRSTKLVMADAVGDAMTQSGGGAKRVLGNRYGLRPKGALR